MAKCAYCGSIIFGGKRDANGRFCNEQCRGRGTLVAFSRQLPDSTVHAQVWKIHQGLCPKCGGEGPVDVYVSHRVWSLLILTSWSSALQLSCRRCGIKSQAAAVAFSLVLGWWGFPGGLIVTPIQIGRNFFSMTRPPEPSRPSPGLEQIVRMNIAAQTLRQQSVQASAPKSQ
jgi:hypothetical protein